MAIAEARRILLCLRYGIGDLVMELPVLDALRRSAPRAHITAVGASPALELLEGDERIDRLVQFQRFGLSHWGDPGSPKMRARIRRWLANGRFDLVIDPSHAVHGFAEVVWENCTSILDAGRELTNEALRGGRRGVAAVASAVREGWGIDVEERVEPRLELSEEETAWAADFLRRRGVRSKPVIGLSPVASSPLKRWPIERLAAVGDHLAERGNALLLFCGPDRAARDRYLDASANPDRVIAVGELHLRRVASLLAACRAFVGNDTGLMHMAAALDTPVVGIFGPTSPSIYLPPGGTAAGAASACSHRLLMEFGPPACVMEGRCLTEAPCIEQPDPQRVIALVTQRFHPGANADSA